MSSLKEFESEHYRSLVYSLPFGLAVIDRTGQIVETNSNLDELSEYNDLDPSYLTKDVNYIDVCKEVGDEHADKAAAGLRSVLGDESPEFKMEYPRQFEGEKRWFLMRVFPVEDYEEDYFITTHLDITARRISGEKSKRFSAIVDKIPVSIVTLRQVEPSDSNGDVQPTFVVTNFNPQAEEATEIDHSEALGCLYSEVFDGLFGSEFSSKLIEVSRNNVTVERDEIESTGSRFEGRVWSLQAFNVTEDFLAIAFEDTTEEVRNRELLQYLAKYDELTGLPNRDHFLETFRTELQRADRYDNSLSLLLMDLDHFKRINDTYGHVYGDEILEGIGSHINDHLRSSDFAGRYGGEEFAVLLPETEEEEAGVFGERLRKAIEQFEVSTESGETVSVSCSIGVSGRKESDETIKDMLLRTDEALYEAKDAGRNQVVCWTDGVSAKSLS